MTPPAPVRFGFLSTAAINAYALAGLEGSTAVEVVAVASRTQAVADAYAATHRLARAHGSYEALLADPEIDAVYIPLPNALHVDWTIRALEAGKHVLCEKPFSRHPADVERAFDTAERTGRLLMEAFMYRHHPQTTLFAELAATEIGELRTIRTSLGGTLDKPDDVRMRTELDGGAMLDVGCYCISAARLLGGEPELAVGTQVLGPSGVDIRFAGVLRFPRDVVATFDCGFDLAPTSVIEAIGSSGRIRAVEAFLLGHSAIELTRASGETDRIETEQPDSYRLEFENLAAAIRGAAEPLLGRADALGQARTIDALFRSAEQGSRPVRVG